MRSPSTTESEQSRGGPGANRSNRGHSTGARKADSTGPTVDIRRCVPIKSYAQHGEDVVLYRAFKHQRTGFYVDVGAAGPVQHSVTKLFYDRGWRGINIEPLPQLHQQLMNARERDINLQVVAGRASGRTPIAVFPDRPGLTTTDLSIAERHEADGFRSEQVTTLMVPLEDILAAHCHEPIDFMKIDVEGAEADVLASFDIRRWAPRVLVVEATQPRSNHPSHHEWEPTVLAAGYRLGLFDGLNRFYVGGDEPGLLRDLSHRAGARETFVTAEISTHNSCSLNGPSIHTP
jgi:FkbM family methyltransferase